jgi:diacylglycerol O-acyltransferase
VISNVPGSPAHIFLAGARLQAQYPVSVIMDGVGLNIRVLSYRDALDVGVVVDRDLVNDAWPLVGHIEAELAELCGLVEAQPRRKTRSTTAQTKEAPK